MTLRPHSWPPVLLPWALVWGWRTHTRDGAGRRRPADVMGINHEKYLRGHENVIITFKTVIKRPSFIEINTVIKRNDGITYSTDVVTSASPAAPRRPPPPPLSFCFIKVLLLVLLYWSFSLCVFLLFVKPQPGQLIVVSSVGIFCVYE